MPGSWRPISDQGASPVAWADGGLASLLLDAISEWPDGRDAPCLVAVDQTFTAGQVLAYVSANVARLRQQGLSAGDVVLLTTGRGHCFWLDMLALWVVGAVAVPIEPNPSQSRLITILEKAVPGWQLGAATGVFGERIATLLG